MVVWGDVGVVVCFVVVEEVWVGVCGGFVF